ncbi:hypothetical protein AGMMS50276_24620 [Synergistales bacterium]|nr:hypothetical protein AGMMS50276_24620 [Synergistales bacterium]
MIEQALKILKVGRNADPETLRQAYVRLVRRYPPEYFPDRFAQTRKAYQQLTLDDDFLDEISQRIDENTTPLGLAAFLWGDRDELAPLDASVLDLIPLIAGDGVRNALDELLKSSASEDMGWKTEQEAEQKTEQGVKARG